MRDKQRLIEAVSELKDSHFCTSSEAFAVIKHERALLDLDEAYIRQSPDSPRFSLGKIMAICNRLGKLLDTAATLEAISQFPDEIGFIAYVSVGLSFENCIVRPPARFDRCDSELNGPSSPLLDHLAIHLRRGATVFPIDFEKAYCMTRAIIDNFTGELLAGEETETAFNAHVPKVCDMLKRGNFIVFDGETHSLETLIPKLKERGIFRDSTFDMELFFMGDDHDLKVPSDLGEALRQKEAELREEIVMQLKRAPSLLLMAISNQRGESAPESNLVCAERIYGRAKRDCVLQRLEVERKIALTWVQRKIEDLKDGLSPQVIEELITRSIEQLYKRRLEPSDPVEQARQWIKDVTRDFPGGPTQCDDEVEGEKRPSKKEPEPLSFPNYTRLALIKNKAWLIKVLSS